MTGTDTSPCYRCEERREGCHAVCKRYRAFAKRRRELSERIREENEQNYTPYKPELRRK